jgi:endoglucanase
VLAARARRDRSDRGALRREDLHIDIGASGRDEAANLVRPGDAGVWVGEPLELPNGRVASKALDDRVGAYAVLEAARRVAEDGGAAVDLVAVASVQEEIGHHGARAAAFALQPDVAIAVDVTYSTDVPGESASRTGRAELGSGAAITRGPVASRVVSDLLAAAAEEDEIPHSFEVLSGATHTDADDVHAARGGVPTGILSVPVRYMHSPSEIASLGDIEAVVRLLVSFAARLTRGSDFIR